MENKTLKYITAICFAINAVSGIVGLLDYFNFLVLVEVVGNIFVVIALLTATPILSTVVFALRSIGTLCVLVVFVVLEVNFERVLNGDLFLWVEVLVLGVAGLVSYVLLMIAGIKLKSAKTLGLIATILMVVGFVALEISNVIGGDGITATDILGELLLTAETLLLGLTYDSFSKKAVVSKAAVTQNSNVSAQGIFEDSNVEKIMRLKSFLDEGVITQEEFDEKKKQILDL